MNNRKLTSLKELVDTLRREPGVRKVYITGSVLWKEEPGDIDIQVYTKNPETAERLTDEYEAGYKVHYKGRIIPVDVFVTYPTRYRGGYRPKEYRVLAQDFFLLES